MPSTILGKRIPTFLVVLMPLLGQAQPPASEIQDLRRAISEQKKALDEQTRKLGELMDRLDRLEAAQPAATNTAAPAGLPSRDPAPPAPPQAPALALEQRDSVGDINAGQIRRGEFPGSLLLPGPRGISIAMGGFIKTLGFYDSNAEGREALFLPSTLGAGRDDIDGSTSLTAELTRLNFDARGTVGKARMRGYLEYDFSGDLFKWRHGYLSLDVDSNQLLAGKYWSNFMDLGVLPEGLGEPTLSGAIFSRQAQFRYTRRLGGNSLSVAVEDPLSNDIVAADPIQSRTAYPDLTASYSIRGEGAHLSISGLLRRITVDPDGEPDYGATGWGVNIGSHLDLGKRDKIAASLSFGRGIGRYMLGITPTSGAFVDIDQQTLSTRGNFGALAHLRHQWNSSCRTTVGAGYATVETDPRQTDSAFRASLFGIANYLCTVNRYFTMGFEYNYGRRWNRAGALDNQRFMFGVQLF